MVLLQIERNALEQFVMEDVQHCLMAGGILDILQHNQIAVDNLDLLFVPPTISPLSGDGLTTKQNTSGSCGRDEGGSGSRLGRICCASFSLSFSDYRVAASFPSLQ